MLTMLNILKELLISCQKPIVEAFHHPNWCNGVQSVLLESFSTEDLPHMLPLLSVFVPPAGNRRTMGTDEKYARKAPGGWEAALEKCVYRSGGLWPWWWRRDKETTAGVSWNDWAATKPIGEMRACPKRHEEKRVEGGKMMCEQGEERETGEKQYFKERKWKPRCQKLQVGEKRNGKKGERVCCLSSIHVTFFKRVEEGGLNVGWVSKATECCWGQRSSTSHLSLCQQGVKCFRRAVWGQQGVGAGTHERTKVGVQPKEDTAMSLN